MYVVGVDENGLGPLLGPLVTTATTWQLSRYQAARVADVGRALGVDDSKATAGFGQMKLAEGLTLAVLEKLTGQVPRDVDSLFGGLLLDGPLLLRSQCPTSSLAQCWSISPQLPCLGGDVQQGREILKGLAARGIKLMRVRSAVSCTGALNRLLRLGQSRVEVDLELMERLVLDARAAVGSEVRAVCGMVGGIRNYPEKLRHIEKALLTPRDAAHKNLAYDVDGVGQLHFEIDADSTHMPVAFASMIGKYVRELWMERQNRFYRSHDPELKDVSGYHDPVTQRFVAQSQALRKRLRIADECFVRLNAKQLG